MEASMAGTKLSTLQRMHLQTSILSMRRNSLVSTKQVMNSGKQAKSTVTFLHEILKTRAKVWLQENISRRYHRTLEGTALEWMTHFEDFKWALWKPWWCGRIYKSTDMFSETAFQMVRFFSVSHCTLPCVQNMRATFQRDFVLVGTIEFFLRFQLKRWSTWDPTKRRTRVSSLTKK